MGHLMAGHVQGGQRLEDTAAVTVGHAKAGIAPEGVVVVVAEMNPAVSSDAVVADPVARMCVFEVPPGDRSTVVGVHGHRLTAGLRGVAPDVVSVREELPGAGDFRITCVVRTVVAALGVLQQEGVGLALVHRRDRDPAGVQGSAGPLCGLQQAPSVDALAGARIDVDNLSRRATIGSCAGHGGLPGNPRTTVQAVDHQFRSRTGIPQLGRPSSLTGRCLGGDGRRDGAHRAERRPGGEVSVPHGARRAGVHHQVAADDREPGEGPVVADMCAAVGVPHHICDDERFLRRPAELVRRRGHIPLSRVDGRRAVDRTKTLLIQRPLQAGRRRRAEGLRSG